MLINALEFHARQQPFATALISNERSWSWADFHQDVSAFAETLRQAKVHRLALALGNTPAWIIADLACLKAGVVCIPVPPFFSEQQREWLMNSAGADAILGPAHISGWALMSTAQGMLHICRKEGLPLLHAGTVKITYTSGTTGTPKGVCLSATGLEWTAAALAGLMKPLSLKRHLVTLPLSTLLENICGSYVPLLLGVTACVPDLKAIGFSGSNQFSSEIFAGALRRWHPQTLVLVPELLRALMIIHRRSPEVTAPLRYVAVGGARVSQQLISTARSAGLPIFEGYGLSECGSVVALNHQHHEMAGSAGKPLEGVSLTFHDAELHVSSPGNALGYLGEAPFTGSIATGDLAEQDTSGFIHIRGRRKNVQINAFGRNFSPEWVEAEAMNCTAVRRLVIFGEGLKKNVALVHAFEGMEASAREQLRALSDRLPDYARPHHLILTPLISSPEVLTANGRPRRDRIWALMKTQILNIEEIR